MDIMDFYSALIFSAIFFLCGKFYAIYKNKNYLKKRLENLFVYKDPIMQEAAPPSLKIYERARKKKYGFLKYLIEPFQKTGEGELELVHKMFESAGLRSQYAYAIYYIIKITITFIFSVSMMWVSFNYTTWDFYLKIGAICGAAFIGNYALDFILNYMGRARQKRIQNSFPYALDLLVICTEAGLGLTAAVQRISREISQISPDLGYELILLSIEMNMLPDRNVALQNFRDRLDAPYFKSIVATIMQAERYGTPIAQTMRTISEGFRQDRLISAEENAAKIPSKLSVLMMIFIFPCVIIIVVGPAILNVYDTMQSI